MLLLAVLSVLSMLGLGFGAILYALANIDGRCDAPRGTESMMPNGSRSSA